MVKKLKIIRVVEKYKVIVSCDHGTNGSWDYDSWSLNIRNLNNKKIKCQIDFKTETLFDDIQVGDYVSYTPILTSFEISNDLTGCTGETSVCNGLEKQSLNPSELNLWRVIRKNEDRSIDLVSEYTSSIQVYFYGKEGYKNYIGALNKIARSYETEGITSDSRYLGYDGQTENILDETSLIQTTYPYSGDTTASNSPKGGTREAKGGGDVLYETDINLVMEACGDNLKAYRIDEKSTSAQYWVASRFYNMYSTSQWRFNGRSMGSALSYKLLCGFNNGIFDISSGNYLRPIVTLKSGIVANTGNGSSENPWKINK